MPVDVLATSKDFNAQPAMPRINDERDARNHPHGGFGDGRGWCRGIRLTEMGSPEGEICVNDSAVEIAIGGKIQTRLAT